MSDQSCSSNFLKHHKKLVPKSCLRSQLFSERASLSDTDVVRLTKSKSRQDGMRRPIFQRVTLKLLSGPSSACACDETFTAAEGLEDIVQIFRTAAETERLRMKNRG